MIRLANKEDLPEIMKVYKKAREFMRKNGNPTQWKGGYPYEDVLVADIEQKRLYVLCEDGDIFGAFAFLAGPDPTYLKIYEGEWRSDEPYFVLHRIASDGRRRGFFKTCSDYCKERCSHLRIDTHHDNIVMQNAVERQGFKKCGIIYLESGDPRIAYEFIG